MAAPQSAANRLFESGGMSVERLPLLRTVFERLKGLATEQLAQFAPTPVEVTLEGIGSGRVCEALEEHGGKGIAAIFHAPQLDARVAVTLDRPCLMGALEAMFGADGSEPAVEEDRALTNVELRIAQTLAEQVMRAFRVAFAPVADLAFRFEKLERRRDPAAIAPAASPAIVARLRLETLGRAGRVLIVIPQTVLQPMRHTLAAPAPAEPQNRDQRWTAQIRKEIQRAEVSLKAVLEEREMTLGQIADFKVGQFIQLQATPRSRVKVECNDQALFRCALGQAEGAYTLRVEEFVDQEQEFMDDILAR